MEDELIYARTIVNHAQMIFHDAVTLKNLIRYNTKSAVNLARTSLLLFVLYLEAIMNYIITDKNIHENYEGLKNLAENEKDYSYEEKWEQVALVCGKSLNKGEKPWQDIKELINIRNNYVHPHYDKPAYYKFDLSEKVLIPADQLSQPVKEIGKVYPNDKITKQDIFWNSTKIPKDLSAIRLKDLETVVRVIDDLKKELRNIIGKEFFDDVNYTTDTVEFFSSSREVVKINELVNVGGTLKLAWEWKHPLERK